MSSSENLKNTYEIMYVVSDLRRVGPTNQTLNIIKYSSKKNKSIVVTLFDETDDSMIEEYKKCNIEVICLMLNRKNFCISGYNKLKKLLNKFDIKILHSYGIKPDYICQKAVKMTKVKHVITLRNFPKEDIFTRMPKLFACIAYYIHIKTLLKADNIVACSKTIESKMKKEYPNIKIISIQNGVDTEKFKRVEYKYKEKLRKKYGIDLNKKVLISTSSFIPRKRIEESIIAFNRVKLDDKYLLLLGIGNEYQRIYEKYKGLKNINFIGKTSNVVEYLQLSDAFVSSSESEGLPNGVMEAIACGLKVILSDIPQHKEILKEIPNSGFCYQLGNIETLTNSIKKVFDYNNANCNIQKSNLTMKNMSKKYVEFYENLLKKEK